MGHSILDFVLKADLKAIIGDTQLIRHPYMQALLYPAHVVKYNAFY